MNQQNQQHEKEKYRPLTSQDQYEMLKRCSDKKDITEWNDWRKEHPEEDILLEGRFFKGWWLENINFIGETVWTQADGRKINFTSKVHLEKTNFESAHLQHATFGKAHLEESCFEDADVKGADFRHAYLENAELDFAHFENCDFTDAILENADFSPSNIIGAKFIDADLRGCSMRLCEVDGSTKFWNCKINRFSKIARFTDLSGTSLDNVKINPGAKQLLEYNIRRINWEEWYKEHKIQKWPAKFFWLFSDYGLNTWRIIQWFLGLAIGFALIYWLWGLIESPGIVENLFFIYKNNDKVEIAWWLVPFRAIHFSVVIMTVGFSSMHANAHSFCSHIIIGLQMILGFVLLGALVTRFAVLFAAGGPAGKFADEKSVLQRLKELWNKLKKWIINLAIKNKKEKRK